jgi:RNA polymerase sigma factor (sigma-70 family)
VEGAGDGNPGTGHDHGGGLRVPGAGRDVALGRDPESQLIAAEEAARIRRCLERLSSRDRELLERRHSLGQSYREIAAALRMTVVNVGVALGRAEARLRSMIEEDGRPGPRPIRDIPEVNV